MVFDLLIFFLLSEAKFTFKMSSLEEGKYQHPDDATDIENSRGSVDYSIDTFESTEHTNDNWFEKFKRIAKKIYKVSSSLLGLIIILIAYSFLGAWIFMAIENRHEEVFKQNITDKRNAIIGQLLMKSRVSSALTTNDMQENLRELLIGYEADIMASYKAGVSSSSTVEVWGFWSSLFFCGTVYTTIGELNNKNRTS